MLTRRTFMQRSALTAGAAAIATSPAATALARRRGSRLRAARGGSGRLLDLPRGFRYRVVQTIDDRLSDGKPVPGALRRDGGVPRPAGLDAARAQPRAAAEHRGRKAPVRVRTLTTPRRRAARPASSSTTASRARASYVTSSARCRNCAGGGTPWGTWVTCEEDRTPAPTATASRSTPTDPENTRSRTPIRDMGWFLPRGDRRRPAGPGIVYLTEDDFRCDQPAAGPRRSPRDAH